MFWGLWYHRPNFESYIYIHYATPPYSARISAIYFVPFGNVWLGSVSVCNSWQAQWQNLRKVGENSDPILSRLWTKVHEIFRQCRKPLVLSNTLFWLSVSRFVQKIFAMKSRSRRKTEQMQKFCGPIFSGGAAPTFLRHFVRATYYALLGKVWLSSICLSLSAKPGNEAECRIYRKWVKTPLQF